MKKILYSILFFAGTCLAFAACSSGDYNANPSSNANNSVNPLQPLDSAQLSSYVTTAGPSTISASINGSGWSSDSLSGWLLDSTGTNIITGISGKTAILLYLKNVYATNIYNMGYNNHITYGHYTNNDSAALPVNAYWSYVGNSGEVQILENDPVYIRGTFYFQGINSTGDVINVTNGYFYIKKD